MKINLFLFILVAIAISTTSCKNASANSAEITEEQTVQPTAGEEVAVDITNSIVTWSGSKPTGTHTGTINLSEGKLIVKDGMINGGSFTMDMNSIANTDLSDNMKSNLEAHLKGTSEGKEDDFFNVAKYPTGKFEITKVTPLEGDDTANYLIYGNLTLRDITNSIGFKANIQVDANGVMASTPPFTINRTDWGINYGSKSIFDNLADKFINDEIGLEIKLVAKN